MNRLLITFHHKLQQSFKRVFLVLNQKPLDIINDLINAHEEYSAEMSSGQKDLEYWQTRWRGQSAAIFELSALILGGEQGATLHRAAASAAIACAASGTRARA